MVMTIERRLNAMRRIIQRVTGLVGVAALAAVVFSGCEKHVNLGPVADVTSAKAIREALASGKAQGESKQAAPTGTGWATLRGQFVYEGDPPQMPGYNVTKEPEVCLVGGKAPPQETLLVDPGSKGIRNVVIFLREPTRVHESANPIDDSVDYDQKHCVFLTHVLGVAVGQTINIKNSDPTGHNTNIVGTGFNPTIPAGGNIPFKVQKDTSMPNEVKCGIHPWMTAYILARKDRYFAVTDAQGNFELANVPAGEPLEFQVWHESGAAAGHGLVGASPDVTDLKWSNRGRVTVTLQPDEKKEVKVVVSPKAFRL